MAVAAAAGVPAFADAADPAAAASGPVVVEAAASPKMVEMEAVVTMVLQGVVVLDKGLYDGVATGSLLPLYDAAPDTATKVGEVSVAQAEEHISSAFVVKSDKAPEKGMIVKYFVSPAQSPALAKQPEAAPEIPPPAGTCPVDMQQVDAGEFAWTPGALTNIDAVSEKGGADVTGNFCVDVVPYKKKLSWSEAALYCGAQGKRLCAVAEQRKVCLRHSKKPACVRKKPGDICPRGIAVEDFVGVQEWSAAREESSAQDPETLITRTGSCGCGGGNAACTDCYYPYCEGAQKKFRCCVDLK